MAEFITTKGTAYHLEQIISGARARLTLISPYLKVSDVFLDRLQDAERRGVATTVIYGKEELQSGERDRLARLQSLQLLFLENLHAKCYFNEEDMVITSMNMYEASERNREMGVRLRAGEPAFLKAVEEAESIIAAATKTRQRRSEEGPALTSFAKRASARTEGVAKSRTSQGHCVRCRLSISLNRSRPLCLECYDVWVCYGNADFEEHYCHNCGDDAATSVRRPLCSNCFRAVAGFAF